MLDLIDFEVGRLRSSMISSRTSSASKFSIGEAAATTTQAFRRRQTQQLMAIEIDRRTFSPETKLMMGNCCRGFARVVQNLVAVEVS